MWETEAERRGGGGEVEAVQVTAGHGISFPTLDPQHHQLLLSTRLQPCQRHDSDISGARGVNPWFSQSRLNHFSVHPPDSYIPGLRYGALSFINGLLQSLTLTIQICNSPRALKTEHEMAGVTGAQWSKLANQIPGSGSHSGKSFR